MDFNNLLQVASMKQSQTEKKKKPAKVVKERLKNNVNSVNVKSFLQRQEEEEKRKAEDAKRKKFELLKQRVEANTQKKKVEVKPKVDKEKDIFDMNEDVIVKPKNPAELNHQTNEEFTGLKISDFDFETKKDRKARAPSTAFLAAKIKLQRIKEKIKGADIGERMAEIDRECSDDEKNPKSKEHSHKPSTPSDPKEFKEHRSSSKHKDRERHNNKDDKHRNDKHRSKDSSSKHKSKHHDRDRVSSHSKSASKPPPSSSFIPKRSVSGSESDISDISLEEVKPIAKPQGWVSVKKKPTEEKPKPKIVKPKNTAPPPPSFQELMALAQQKSGVPVLANGKPAVVAEIPKRKKEERPMTQEEKDRKARVSSKEYQDWMKTGKPIPKAIPRHFDRSSLAPHPTRVGSSAHQPSKEPSAPVKAVVPHPSRPASKQPLVNGSHSDKSSKNVPSKNGLSSSSHKSNGARDSPRSFKDSRDSSSSSSKSKNKSKDDEDEIVKMMRLQQEQIKKQQEEMDRLMKIYEEKQKHKAAAASTSKPSSSSAKPSSAGSSKSSSNARPAASSSSKPKQSVPPPPSSLSSSKNGNSASLKRPKHDMSDDEDAMPARKKPAPEKHVSAWDRIYGQIQDRNPKPKKKPNRIEDEFDEYDDEDEHDSEMDDFIDDEAGAANYSKHIRNIFGYDKRKFRNERDEDLRGMEANFSQISREEARSSRLGMQEDLEDIRREEAELKRKRTR